MTLRLMTMHHHTMFGYKKSISSENTVQTEPGHVDSNSNYIYIYNTAHFITE